MDPIIISLSGIMHGVVALVVLFAPFAAAIALPVGIIFLMVAGIFYALDKFFPSKTKDERYEKNLRDFFWTGYVALMYSMIVTTIMVSTKAWVIRFSDFVVAAGQIAYDLFLMGHVFAFIFGVFFAALGISKPPATGRRDMRLFVLGIVLMALPIISLYLQGLFAVVL